MSSPEDYTEAQASDPGTEPAVLGEIATHRPDLRPAIAGNPTAYPDLLDWLANLNDPAVNAALAARSQSATGPVPAQQPASEAPTAQQPAVDATQVQQPVASQQAPAQQAPVQEAPAQQYAGAPEQSAYTGQPVAAQGEVTGWNFRGLGVSDILRDVIAAMLLLMSIPMVWRIADQQREAAGDRPEVLIITLLSLVSLTLPYLARIGAMGPKWTVHSTRKSRWILNAPYLILVIAYIVLDVIHYGDYSGLGTAAMFGLAGAILAAQPRACELGPEHEDKAGASWLNVTSGIGGLIAVTYIASLVVFILQINNGAAPTMLSKIAPIVGLLLVAGFSVWPVFAASLGKTPGWRRALIGLGISLAVIAFLAEPSGLLLEVQATGTVPSGNEPSVGVLPLVMVNGLGSIFIPAAAAAISAPAVARAVRQQPPVQTWVEGARSANMLVAYVGLTALVGAILGFWLYGDIKPNLAFLITSLILSLAIIGVAMFTVNALAKDPVTGRPKAIATAVITAILGIVLLMSVPTNGGPVGDVVSTGHLLVAAALPIFILVSLLAPKPVREFFAQQQEVRPANTAAYEWTSPGGNAGYYQNQPQR